MLPTEVDYDVYITPRIGVIQFGDFVAGDANEREALLRGAKFYRRTHRARAWYARKEISKFFLDPFQKVASLDAAVEAAESDAANPTHSEEKQNDAAASVECLRCFIGLRNLLPIGGKQMLPIQTEQAPMILGGTDVLMELACLTLTPIKGKDHLGGILLNTQKGKGLGSQTATKQKRNKAGESVAILVYQCLADRHSDLGEPFHKDALHVYVRAEHYWHAPKFLTQKLKNLEADGRAIANQWDAIQPPSDFDPQRAAYHG